MRQPETSFRRPRMLARSAAAASLLAVLMASGATVPAAAQVVCESDDCDNNLWQKARGDGNTGSYWGMSPGHNCTNYVAWKLIQDGVTKPATHPGNASTWAARAAVDGYLVDRVPAVGSVAQWDSYASGYSVDGHVAYVEQVNDDGTIVVSEDFWFGGSQTGELTFRVVDPATVSNFIHYSDTSALKLRVIGANAGSWWTMSAGIAPVASALTAADIGGVFHTFYLEEGRLKATVAQATGWETVDTGLAVDGSIAAVDMGNGMPYVMAVHQGQLTMIVRTSSGWQYMPTGQTVSGPIAATNIGGLWPTVYAVEDGTIVEIWGDNEGWHKRTTLMPALGTITASTNAQGWPEVFWSDGQNLHRAWADSLGWQTETLPVAAASVFSSTRVIDSVQVAFDDGGRLSVAFRDPNGVWISWPTGLRSGTQMAAVVGVEGPRVVQLG